MEHDQTTKCRICGTPFKASSSTTGYGYDNHGHRLCFECIGKLDRRALARTGRATLYLSKDGEAWKLTNWSGTFVVPHVKVRVGRHNVASTRYDAWFTVDGTPYHGVTYGENTQLCHVKAYRSYPR